MPQAELNQTNAMEQLADEKERVRVKNDIFTVEKG
jgi:hypothetical protein